MKSKDLLVALFALGLVLLSWPFLTVVNRPVAVLGIPSLVLYLFLVGYGMRSFLKVGGGFFEQTALTLGAGILVNHCLVLSGQHFARVFAAGRRALRLR